MIKLEVNGLPFSEANFERAAVDAVASQIRARLSSIRHPVTGEFPTILVTGSTLETLEVKLEGSPEFIALAKRRLARQEGLDVGEGDAASPVNAALVVFLSYAFEDHDLAERIANALNDAGIETWWAGWEMRSGDSLRQRIDEGLGSCTHFLVLLTPQSLNKPWVRLEMDAGLVQHLSGKAKFIPLRSGLAPGEMPPLLRGMVSPAVDPATFDVSQLISDIYGISKKPPLGQAPAVLTKLPSPTETGYSEAATAVAKVFVEGTTGARKFDPSMSLAELADRAGLTLEDASDALHELSNMATLHRGERAYPEDELFVEFDRHWKEWNPKDDARAVATAMVNDPDFPSDPAQIAKRLEWPARRLNPALAFLDSRNLVKRLRAMNAGPWLLAVVASTEATRRFVKNRA
jgi:hypothetical protein